MLSDEERARLSEANPDALVADGLEAAYVGYASQHGSLPLAVYDADRCIEALMQESEMTCEEATEWFYFNVVSAYCGQGTPLFLFPSDQTETT
mgnify:CR=1 FL=1